MSPDGENGAPKNYRNGYSKKTVKTHLGEVNVKVPHDRNDGLVLIINCVNAINSAMVFSPYPLRLFPLLFTATDFFS